MRGILPKDVEKALDRLGDRSGEVRENIETDFYDWMNKRRSKDAPSSARQSFWKTYDALLGPLAALGAKRMAEKLFAVVGDREAKATGEGDISHADMAVAKLGRK
ncbi:hypothetical protein BH20CHL6_BH20CHL6_07110 [soil metagenome]